jgi:SAM-dependent methyltransferase
MLITLTECQLCGGSDLLNLGDFNIEDEAAQKMLGANAKSRWCVCSKCNFTFQNPRFSREYQERWYEESNYRKMNESELITPGYLSFAPQQLARFYLWLRTAGLDLQAIQNCTCLDYGCGIGAALNFLAEKNNKNFGVELDKRLGDYGNSHNKIQIVQRSADLPVQTEFDLIFSHNALEHVYDPNDFFSFASRGLKKNGVLILLVPAWRYANTTIALQEFNWSHNCMYDHVSMAGFLNKYGFFMSSHLYQNPDVNGDWELCCVAHKSPRKNYFTSSIEEVFQELHVNIPRRSADRSRNADQFPDKITFFKN